MLTIKNYVKVKSLEEAYELNQKKSNRVIGGMLWLCLSDLRVQTAIDLSGLGLDQIEETEEAFSIGCMTTLRQLELHGGLDCYTGGALRESLRHIVGVQFRNLATVGGSIYGRFGFSDVLTMFLVLDTYVELYRGGILSLKEFLARKKDRDILVRLIVKKKPVSCCYISQRNTKTDFPVLTCAAACLDGRYRAAIGARPAAAVLVEEEGEMMQDPNREQAAKAFANRVAEQVATGSNMRAGKEYRTHLCRVLTERAVSRL